MADQSIFNWSGGKDSAMALYQTLQNDEYQVRKLMTTVNSKYERISMHGVRRELLQLQAQSIGLDLQEILLPETPTMEEYDTIMRNILLDEVKDGITHSIFGDIFLEDLKKYREQKLSEVGLKGHFPIWKRDTTELIHEFLDLGFKTVLVCINADLLDKSFAGRVIDRDFLKDLPSNVDPCGENGEFHTFVFDGPIFQNPIKFQPGEVVLKKYNQPNGEQGEKMGFYFQDLVPK